MSPKLEQAVELIREDRPEAVDEALALLQNTVYSFSMKVCGHPEDAEDTMQEVLVKLLPYLPKFDSPQALSVWLKKEKERFRNRFKVLRFPVFRCPGWNSLSMIIAWPGEERIVTAAIDPALRDLYAAHVLDAKWKS